MDAHFLAFDLGAESGRAMSGRLRSGVLDLAEVCRFPNEPVREHGSLHWDILRLWLRHAAGAAAARGGRPRARQHRRRRLGLRLRPARRARRAARQSVSLSRRAHRRRHGSGLRGASARARIYDITGTQFLSFNTLYQLIAARQRTPRLLDAATGFGTIPDILNYWLTGVLRAEYTAATTTQMIDARARNWADALLRELDIPTRLLPPLVEPGTVLGGLKGSVAGASRGHAGRRARVPRHRLRGGVGAGVRRPRVSQLRHLVAARHRSAAADHHRRARSRPTSPTKGACAGTTRLLKNIGGLWLLQSCRRGWARDGRNYDYAELMDAAGDDRHAFLSLFDPDDPAFLHPPDMASAIADYCRRTGQPEPAGPASFTRAILESLAFKYRVVLDTLEELTGIAITEVQIVGGGSRNRLLNQFTADATGRTVLAGPAEATALGNIAMQMLATGAVASRRRGAPHHRILIPRRSFRARSGGSLGRALPPLPGLRGADLRLTPAEGDGRVDQTCLLPRGAPDGPGSNDGVDRHGAASRLPGRRMGHRSRSPEQPGHLGGADPRGLPLGRHPEWPAALRRSPLRRVRSRQHPATAACPRRARLRGRGRHALDQYLRRLDHVVARRRLPKGMDRRRAPPLRSVSRGLDRRGDGLRPRYRRGDPPGRQVDRRLAGAPAAGHRSGAALRAGR